MLMMSQRTPYPSKKQTVEAGLLYNNCYKFLLLKTSYSGYISELMLNSDQVKGIRKKLGLTQEEMARFLGVSFVSVNRWEAGHSTPTGPFLDLYQAADAAIRAGNTPEVIRQAANSERGAFLYSLFRMAYSGGKRRSR